MNDEQWSEKPPAVVGDPAPPEGSTIEIVEHTADRLVLFIPAGAKRGWELGCFGLIWLTIVSIITAALLNGIRQQGGPGPAAILFLIPFWIVGLTLLYFSLKMRHTRTLVLVEPTRAVLQQTFLGRTKTRETTLTPGEAATLVESYSQNDVPVDAVCLMGDPRPLKFATPLEHREKAWIVDRINDFLGVSPAHNDDPLSGPMPTYVMPEKCTACGGELPPLEGEIHEATCPFCGAVNKARMTLIQTGPSDTQAATGEFPSERVTVLDQTADRLEFGMRVFESGAMRRGAATVFVIFALIWNSIVATFVWATVFGARFNVGSLITLVFLIPFIAVGLAIAGVALFILAGRLRVQLDRDALRASWGVGPLGYAKTFTTGSITHVTVENSPMAVKSRRPRSSSDPETRMAIVWAGERWIPVTMLQGVNDCRHVAELVRGQLADMGFQVENRRTAVSTTLPDFDSEEDEDDDTDPLDEEEGATSHET